VRIVSSADAEVPDGAHQLVRLDVGPDLARVRRGVEQPGADRHQAVEEPGVQRLEAGAVRPQHGGEPVLGDQEVDEHVDPPPERGARRRAGREQRGAGLGAGLHLVPVDGDDQVRPGGEVPVDRGRPDAGFGRDVAHRRRHAGPDEDRGGRVEQRRLVAPGVRPLGPGRPLRALADLGHRPVVHRTVVHRTVVHRTVPQPSSLINGTLSRIVKRDKVPFDSS
jgi:hypothetical protein